MSDIPIRKVGLESRVTHGSALNGARRLRNARQLAAGADYGIRPRGPENTKNNTKRQILGSGGRRRPFSAGRRRRGRGENAFWTRGPGRNSRGPRGRLPSRTSPPKNKNCEPGATEGELFLPGPGPYFFRRQRGLENRPKRSKLKKMRRRRRRAAAASLWRPKAARGEGRGLFRAPGPSGEAPEGPRGRFPSRASPPKNKNCEWGAAEGEIFPRAQVCIFFDGTGGPKTDQNV